MRKIVCIGECSLNIVLDDKSTPQGCMPGGRLVETAAILARKGYPVLMASETAADPTGDIIVRYLQEAKVDTSILDRYTEGRTPLNIFTQDSEGKSTLTRYEKYPDECFDIVWPRLDEGDIVVYGGHYTLDARMRTRLSRFLENAAERKAVMVYLPGFMIQQEPRITRVMPALLENLELADVVIARSTDLQHIYNNADADAVYRRHIDFYCRSFINVDAAAKEITFFSGNEKTTLPVPEDADFSLTWNAGATAGIVASIFDDEYTPEIFRKPPTAIRRSILERALHCAQIAAQRVDKEWMKI